MRRFFLIRHGNAYDKRWKQDAFSELNETGEQHANALAERFRDFKVNEVYSSTMVRSVETCKAFLKYHPHVKPVFDDGLREVVNLDFLNQHAEVVFLTDNFSKISENVIKQFRYVESRTIGDSVFVFTHGYFIRFLVASVLHLGAQGFFNMEVGFASVTVIEEDEGKLKLIVFNDCCHTKGLPYGCAWCK